MNAEVLVAATVVAVPDDQQLLAVIVCTVGQMLAKTGLYAGARWLPHRLPARANARLERASAKVKRVEQAGWTLVLISALVGLPPFYVVSLAAGVMRLNLTGFIVAGLIGRLVRFGIIAYAALAAGDALQVTL